MTEKYNMFHLDLHKSYKVIYPIDTVEYILTILQTKMKIEFGFRRNIKNAGEN